MAVKKKKYQTGGTTTGTLEQRHDPILAKVEQQSGAVAGTAPIQLPTGTEVTYTPQTIQQAELEATTDKLVGAQAPITSAAVPTAQAVTVPTAASPGTYSATTVANSVSDANAQLSSLSQGAITAPQGTVSQQALATAAQGTSAQATAPTRVLSASEQFDAANVASVGGFSAATAQTMNTPQEATVQYQLQQLMSQFDNNQIPAFASGAIQMANAQMLARGVGASSMAGQAILKAAMETATVVAVQDAQVHAKFNLQNLSNQQQTALVNAQLRATLTGQELTNEQQERVLNTAKVSEVNNLNFSAEQAVALENAKLMQGMKISNLTNSQQAALQNAAILSQMDTKNLDARLTTAVQNAKDFLQMDLTNLSNKQQAEVLNSQSKNQALLSDSAGQNAALQFNAKSQDQVDQFYKTLGAQISAANVNRTAAMQQFEVDQVNALAKFNSQVNDSRNKFDAEMSQVIDQSNVTWRRSINTANTAEQNRANQINTQNLLDISLTAQNQLWNRYRDEATWLVNLAESREARAHQVAMQSQADNFDKSMYDDDIKNNIWMGIGGAILGGIWNKYKPQ